MLSSLCCLSGLKVAQLLSLLLTKDMEEEQVLDDTVGKYQLSIMDKW